jgi:hypothetical protein
MSFSEFERKRIDKIFGEFCRNRVPDGIKDQLRYVYRVENRIVILSESRPRFDRPSVWLTLDFAKFQYIQTRKLWKLYWMRASGKWETYKPHGEDADLSVLLDVMAEDRHGCFFG